MRIPTLILAAGMAVLAGCSVIGATTETSSATPETSPSVEATPAEAPRTLTAPPSTDKIPPVGPTWLRTEDVGGLGTIVVDGSGRTVYFSTQETQNAPTCYNVCADTWLPLLTSADPAGGVGIRVAEAEAVTRRDGSRQASYKGHPLYYYAGDTAPGQANGNGLDLFGATWYALSPAGGRVG